MACVSQQHGAGDSGKVSEKVEVPDSLYYLGYPIPMLPFSNWKIKIVPRCDGESSSVCFIHLHFVGYVTFSKEVVGSNTALMGEKW